MNPADLRTMKMKRCLALLILTPALAGCELYTVVAVSDPLPATPAALTSITADGAVYLSWEDGSPVPSDHFRIYRGEGSGERLDYLASTSDAGFVDFAVQNGRTYFYGVTAVSPSGRESGLSRVVGDTPRPEGYDLVLFEADTRPDRSGFDLSSRARLYPGDPHTDIYVQHDPVSGLLLLLATLGTDLQDMGYTGSLDDISASPTDGWSPDGSAVLVTGHTYVVWTHDNHFAKLRAVEVAPTWARLDWAYQVDPGNPELVKPAHDSAYGRRLHALQFEAPARSAGKISEDGRNVALSAGTRGARR